MRRGVAAASVWFACLALPATSWAARIELRPEAFGTRHLVYTGGPGEVNDPGLYSNMTTHYVQDIAGPPTERIPPCEASVGGLGTSSRCPNVEVVRLVVDLGDRDDIGDVDENTMLFHPVTVLGGPGNDRISMHSVKGNTLDGGPGDDAILSEVLFSDQPLGPGDTVTGGDGNDELRVRNQRRDDVRCGPGSDTVTADVVDVVTPDCEMVELPQARWTRADGKPIGVTIDGAARFTRTRHVRLKIRAPDVATHVRISNDGAFDAFLTVTRRWSERYTFDLASSGRERLPNTVYVRFDGPGLDPSRTFTDDIILDETRPQCRFARFLVRSRGRSRIALRAGDAISGVKIVQFARIRSRPWKAIKYRSRVHVRRAPRWVRVRDGAGNASSWRRVARFRAGVATGSGRR